MKLTDLAIESIPGGVRVRGDDPDLSMDDLADAMWDGFLRSEVTLREHGQSHFRSWREEAKMADKALSYGEKAVGLAFNPSGDPDVEKLKKLFAEIVDHCEQFRNSPAASDEKKRLWSIAIIEAQSAQMWAVKAQTWRD
jgi:hypothetical protein